MNPTAESYLLLHRFGTVSMLLTDNTRLPHYIGYVTLRQQTNDKFNVDHIQYRAVNSEALAYVVYSDAGSFIDH